MMNWISAVRPFQGGCLRRNGLGSVGQIVADAQDRKSTANTTHRFNESGHGEINPWNRLVAARITRPALNLPAIAPSRICPGTRQNCRPATMGCLPALTSGGESTDVSSSRGELTEVGQPDAAYRRSKVAEVYCRRSHLLQFRTLPLLTLFRKV